MLHWRNAPVWSAVEMPHVCADRISSCVALGCPAREVELLHIIFKGGEIFNIRHVCEHFRVFL